MAFIADLHIHSKYSRACSKNLDLPHINAWCQLKGIDLVGTADFTHPAWFKNINSQLEEADTGIYKLKSYAQLPKDEIAIPEKCRRDVHFILSTEISLIYKSGGRVRKTHHVVLAPDIATAAKINVQLEKRGNIHSDGRPILGLNSKELLKILLDISHNIQLIPAHVWTPHFSIFGSKSGFDSVEECFGELSGHICALETGLSSDPPMNWRLSKNDKYALVSSSDAHSCEKLGREATIFDIERNYPAILNVLRHDHSKIIGTIEFFPEEGKYHADGLRAENLCLTPEETKKNNFVSLKTGKKITVGVLHRVNDLADRKMGEKPSSGRPYWHLIPLREILGEIYKTGPSSKKVTVKYFELLNKLGPELAILKDISPQEIAVFDSSLGEAIRRMREGNVIIQPGYDGEFGVIKLFKNGETIAKNQSSLF